MGMKKIVLAGFLLLLAVSASADDFNCTTSLDTGSVAFGQIGNCIVGVSFGGYTFLGFFIMMGLAAGMWKVGVGKAAFMPLALVMGLALASINSDAFGPWLTLGVFLMAIFFVVLVIRYVKG